MWGREKVGAVGVGGGERVRGTEADLDSDLAGGSDIEVRMHWGSRYGYKAIQGGMKGRGGAGVEDGGGGSGPNTLAVEVGEVKV